MSDTTPSKTVKNASEMPKRYYGLHFYPGVAEYSEPGAKSYRIMLNEATLRQMDDTFTGCPVYVKHKDEVDLKNIQTEADGFVVKSFYNELDGKHWCEFIIVSDKGHQAIRNGWKLSNAYIPEAFGPGGLWNGVEYQKEVTRGKFEHLAIVPDPRYQDANVLTPAEFQAYTDNLRLELKKVANSAKRGQPMFEFFKKTKVESTDISETVVKLPKSGKEVTIAQLINAADIESKDMQRESKHEESQSHKNESDPADEDKHEAKDDKEGKSESEAEDKKQGHKEESEKEHEAPMMANMDHHVMDGEKSRPLHEIMSEHKEMKDCMSAMGKYMKNDEQMDGGEKDAAAKDSAQDADLTKRNADEDGGEKEAAEQEKSADKTKRNSKFFNDLKDAPNTILREPVLVDLDKAERGKARYGSGN